MKNCCFNEACERTAVILCEGHLQAYILTVVASVLDAASEELMNDLALNPDED